MVSFAVEVGLVPSVIGSGIVSDLVACIWIRLLLIWPPWIVIIDVDRHRRWDSVGIGLYCRCWCSVVVTLVSVGEHCSQKGCVGVFGGIVL